MKRRRFVIESAERERKTSEIGELIMNRLRRYDKVAYVRFASVYLDFKDVQEFMTELKDLLKTKDKDARTERQKRNRVIGSSGDRAIERADVLMGSDDPMTRSPDGQIYVYSLWHIK